MGSPEQLTGTSPGPPLRSSPDASESAAAAWLILLAALAARLILAVALGFAFWSLLPVALGFTSTVVMSDSMAPRIREGDVVISRPITAWEARIGTVVLVDDPDWAGRMRLHRLVAIDPAGDLVLRGDANGSNDAARITPDHLHSVGFLRVPAAGLPILWLRTGQYGPLAAGIAATAVLLALARLEVPEPGAPRPGGVRGHQVTAMARRVRRLRSTGPLLLVAAVVVTAGAAAPTARAAFTDTTSTGAEQFATATGFACSSRSLPAALPTPWAYYEYQYRSPASTEPDSSGSGHEGVFHAGAAHAAGTCAAGASDSLTVDGTDAGFLTAGPTVLSPTTFTIATWFRTRSARGRIIGFGSEPTSPSASLYYDRHLYVDTAGRLVFGVRTSGFARLCSSTGAVDDGAWHHAVATYADGSGMHLYLDGQPAIACDPDPAGQIGAYSGYWRLGYDTLDAAAPDGWTDAAADSAAGPGGAFSGSLDETAIWTVALSPAQASALYGFGH